MVTPLKKNTIANLVGSNWPNVLGLVLVPFYLKFIGAEGYGLVGLLATLSSLCLLLDLGISSALGRELARFSAHPDKAREQQDLVRTLEIIYWALAIVVTLSLLLSAPLIANRWINPKGLSPKAVEHCIRLMAFVIGFQFSTSFYQGGLMGLQRLVPMNILLVFLATFRGVGAILVLWRVSPTVEALFLWSALVGGIQAVSMAWLLRKNLPNANIRPRFDKKLLPGVWQYAAYVSGNAVVGLLLTQLDKIILVKILALETFGYYMIAWNMASALWAVIVPINMAFFPQFVRLFEKRDSAALSEFFHNAAQVLSVAVIPVGTILVIFSRELLTIWLGNPLIAEKIHTTASLLVAGVVLNGICSVPVYASSAFGWPQLIMYTNLSILVVFLPSIFMITPKYGIEGTATLYALINCVYFFIMTPIVLRKYFPNDIRDFYIKDVVAPLFGSCLIGTLSWIFLYSNNYLYRNKLPYIFISLVIIFNFSILSSNYVRGWIASNCYGLWRNYKS